MELWHTFERKGSVEARPYVDGEDLSHVSVSEVHLPLEGGWIARNPDYHEDQWYINEAYFNKNYNRETAKYIQE